MCSYLGNKLFALRDDDMDRYLPQLTVMYAELAGAAEALRPYLIRRCRRSSSFALRLCCLLASYSGSSTRATQLRDQILAGDQPARRGHARSRSDASALRPAPPIARHLGDLASGRAFDNGCLCVDRCACAASSLATQIQVSLIRSRIIVQSFWPQFSGFLRIMSHKLEQTLQKT